MSESRKLLGRIFSRLPVLCLMAGALVAGMEERVHGLFHAVVIDEVLTSFGDDPDKQFVEMRMLGSSQNFVHNSVFAAFNDQGTYVDDILVVPSDLGQSGAGTRWLIATSSAAAAFGIQPDFLIAPGALPVGGGMICFGGGGGVRPLDPPSWDRTNFSNYVDCVAYGSYSGPGNSRTGTPTTLDADGHSLQRTTSTFNNLADFTCAEITARNNSGAMVEIAASDSCSSEATPTPTEPSGPTATATASPTVTRTPTATPTPTVTPATTSTPTATAASSATLTPTSTESATPTSSATATPGPSLVCVADCDGSGEVSLDEVVRAVQIALAPHLLPTCEEADANQDGSASIDELLRAVASSMQDCTDRAR